MYTTQTSKLSVGVLIVFINVEGERRSLALFSIPSIIRESNVFQLGVLFTFKCSSFLFGKLL